MKTAWILVTAAVAMAANAAPADTPQDYAWSMPLAVSGKAGVVGLRLPQAVYLHATSAALDDVRLFDKNGQPLAFALRQTPPQARTSRRDVPATIFPLTGAAASGGPANQEGLDIRTGADGRLLSVRSVGKSATASAGDTLQALVLDLGASQPALQYGALRFTLPPATTNYNAQVLLEVSDDLKQWDTVGASALNWLANADTKTLANDRMEFAPRSFRYARLSWREGTPLLFASISAEAVSATEVAPYTEHIVLQGAPGKNAPDLIYNAPPAVPATSIGVELKGDNVVLPVQLGMYQELRARQAGQPTTWQFQPQLGATFYQISQGGQQRKSGDLTIPPTHAAQWVLRPQTAQASPPALRLGWTPANLVFLANGNAPYTLAYGKRDAARAALSMTQVAPGFSDTELNNLEQATLGQPAAGRAAGIEPGHSEPVAWRLYALWGALLLGVGVLGFFAWRLLAQMKEDDQAT